jgi:hypothetical protein
VAGPATYSSAVLVKNLGWELPAFLLLVIVVAVAAVLGAETLGALAMWAVAFLTPVALLSASLRVVSALRR